MLSSCKDAGVGLWLLYRIRPPLAHNLTMMIPVVMIPVDSELGDDFYDPFFYDIFLSLLKPPFFNASERGFCVSVTGIADSTECF